MFTSLRCWLGFVTRDRRRSVYPCRLRRRREPSDTVGKRCATDEE